MAGGGDASRANTRFTAPPVFRKYSSSFPKIFTMVNKIHISNELTAFRQWFIENRAAISCHASIADSVTVFFFSLFCAFIFHSLRFLFNSKHPFIPDIRHSNQKNAIRYIESKRVLEFFFRMATTITSAAISNIVRYDLQFHSALSSELEAFAHASIFSPIWLALCILFVGWKIEAVSLVPLPARIGAGFPKSERGGDMRWVTPFLCIQPKFVGEVWCVARRQNATHPPRTKT